MKNSELRYITLLFFSVLFTHVAFSGSQSAISITKYGAVGDGKRINTKSIQEAIDKCAKNGGGTVIIPSGIFVSGSIELKSNINLYLSPGAVLRGSDKIEDYIPNPFYHNEFKKTTSLLWAINQSNISITGTGIIDLNDSSFIDFTQFRQDFGMGTNIPLNDRQRMESTAKDNVRPTQPVFFQNCCKLQITGITIQNSPCWTLSFHSSRDIKISRITILNNLRTPNSDGIHCCSCKDVIITDSSFSCGDDCVAITGISDWKGISESIVVSNCTMISRSAAIRIGHSGSKVRNIIFNNIVIRNSNRGIAIFAEDGGWVKDIQISNITMDTRLIAGAWWGKGEPLVIVAGGNGDIDGVSVNNVRAKSDNGILIFSNADNISNIDIHDWFMELRYGNNRSLFKPLFDILPLQPIVAPDPKQHIPWIFASNVNGLRLCDIKYLRKEEDGYFSMEPSTIGSKKMEIENCENLTIK